MISVVIPAFNEEGGLAEVVSGLRARLEASGRAFEIIVVDDGSRDRTLEVARGLGVMVVTHGTNRGYGAALKTGIRAATGDQILICDGDGTYPPESIPELLTRADGHDMVVAARTGASVEIPIFRRIAKGILRRLAIYLSDSEIPDLNSGLRVFRRHAAMAYFPILPSGFSFTTTITLAMLCNEGSVVYVPINYSKRRGRSKIRPLRDTLNFLILILRTILYFNPLKIFLPVSLAIGVMFAASLAYDLFVLKDLTEKTLIFLFGSVQMLAVGLLADLITKRFHGGGR
ncbi:MAG TPA: glycosyltransferase family 2 protein [Candidatus Polarisedimenticolia bacterium]